jgi:hypothetical protein
MNRTAWYPESVKPVHLGIYERDLFENGPTYSRWDGKFWFSCWGSVEDAANSKTRSLYQSLKWRGLAGTTLKLKDLP